MPPLLAALSAARRLGEDHCCTGFTCSYSLPDPLVMSSAPLQCQSTPNSGGSSQAKVSAKVSAAPFTSRARCRLHHRRAAFYIISRSGLCSAARSQLASGPEFQIFQSKNDSEKDHEVSSTDGGERNSDSVGAPEDASDSTEAKDSQPPPSDPPPSPEYEFNPQLLSDIVT